MAGSHQEHNLDSTGHQKARPTLRVRLLKSLSRNVVQPFSRLSNGAMLLMLGINPFKSKTTRFIDSCTVLAKDIQTLTSKVSLGAHNASESEIQRYKRQRDALELRRGLLKAWQPHANETQNETEQHFQVAVTAMDRLDKLLAHINSRALTNEDNDTNDTLANDDARAQAHVKDCLAFGHKVALLQKRVSELYPLRALKETTQTATQKAQLIKLQQRYNTLANEFEQLKGITMAMSQFDTSARDASIEVSNAQLLSIYNTLGYYAHQPLIEAGNMPTVTPLFDTQSNNPDSERQGTTETHRHRNMQRRRL